jgi:hypothetical protein
MIKSVGDFISTQRNSLSTLCVILEGFAHIYFCKLSCLSDGSMHVGYMITCYLHFLDLVKPFTAGSTHMLRFRMLESEA